MDNRWTWMSIKYSTYAVTPKGANKGISCVLIQVVDQSKAPILICMKDEITREKKFMCWILTILLFLERASTEIDWNRRLS